MLSTWQPGAALNTRAEQTLQLDVARIGQLTLAPSTRVTLLETRRGAHRVQLEQGQLRAKIWAPPGWFVVSGAGWELVDLGCEFELFKQSDGSGSVLVHSGWIAYRTLGKELLLPAGFAAQLAKNDIGRPLRPQASVEFHAAIGALDQQLAHDPQVAIAQTLTLANQVAATAQIADAYTLLNILQTHPQLAGSRVYDQLAEFLNLPIGSAHREDWRTGDLNAINLWWNAFPAQPKDWWANWRDAF